jgi:hypothetical protein
MSTDLNDVGPTTRQCGRCRKSFPSDPTLPLSVRLDWWLCPPCHEALLGPQRAGKHTQGC